MINDVIIMKPVTSKAGDLLSTLGDICKSFACFDMSNEYQLRFK